MDGVLDLTQNPFPQKPQLAQPMDDPTPPTPVLGPADTPISNGSLLNQLASSKALLDQPVNSYQPAKVGRVKAMLTNFLGGMSDGLAASAGLPTSFDRQMAQQKMAIEQQNANSLAQLRTAQSMTMPVSDPDMANMLGVPVGTSIPAKQYIDALMKKAKLDSDESRAQDSNATKTAIANARNSTMSSIADKRIEAMRQATEQRLAMSKSIAQLRANTALTAKQMGINAGFQREGMKAYDLALDSDKRYQQMQEQVQNPNPASDKALLFNHIAMTLGNVKGGRVTQAEIESHLKARDLGSDIMQAWDQLTTGKSLTTEQRQNFLNLASEVRGSTWDQAFRKADYFGVKSAPEDNPAIPAARTHVARPGGNGTTYSANNPFAHK